jgi:hypothetical protein
MLVWRLVVELETPYTAHQEQDDHETKHVHLFTTTHVNYFSSVLPIALLLAELLARVRAIKVKDSFPALSAIVFGRSDAFRLLI